MRAADALDKAPAVVAHDISDFLHHGFIAQMTSAPVLTKKARMRWFRAARRLRAAGVSASQLRELAWFARASAKRHETHTAMGE